VLAGMWSGKLGDAGFTWNPPILNNSPIANAEYNSLQMLHSRNDGR